MLKYLKLVNIQSHQDTTLYFAPGVNVITGVSQHGKSAIVKGLEALVKNRGPSGKNKAGHPKIIYRKAKPLIGLVEAETSEGNVVSLTKSKSGSVYTVNGNEYKGFGMSVPDDVENALNFGELNIQKQLELPFLLTKVSPGQIAKKINDITRLGDADIWQSNLTTEINTINVQLVNQERLYTSAIDKIKKYKKAGSEELTKKLKRINLVTEEIDILASEIEQIIDLVDSYEQAEEGCNNIGTALIELVQIERWLEEVEREEAAQQELYDYFELVNAVEVLGKVDEVAILSGRIDSNVVEADGLRGELDDIVQYRALQARVEEIAILFEHSLKDYAKALKETKVCPFCGGKIGPAAIKKSVEAMR